MEAVGVGVFVIIWLAFFAVMIGGFVLWIYCLIEVVKLPEHAYRLAGKDKTTWVLVVALVQMIGAVIWWFSARREVKAAAAAYPYLPQAAYGPPPGWYPDPSGSGGQRWWDGRQWAGGPPSL